MDPMSDVNLWSEQRREEALRQARRRSMAKQRKGERKIPFNPGGLGSALGGVLGLFR
jgi:hypothetical protein